MSERRKGPQCAWCGAELPLWRPHDVLPNEKPCCNKCADRRYQQWLHSQGEGEMGNWAITISGHGSHHNGGATNDADRIAAEMVTKLRDVGQVIDNAVFVSGDTAQVIKPAK